MIYNQRYSQYNTKQNRLCFSRHLRILRYEQLKEFSKLLMFCLQRFAQSIGLLLVYCLSAYFVLQVFIPIYRVFERRWEFSRYINLSCFEALILHPWSFAWFDSCPRKNQFQIHSITKGTTSAAMYCYLCLDIETKIAEMVVVELMVVHFVHCPLSTLVKLLLTRYASDDVSSGALFWTRFFRRISSDAFFQTLISFK